MVGIKSLVFSGVITETTVVYVMNLDKILYNTVPLNPIFDLYAAVHLKDWRYFLLTDVLVLCAMLCKEQGITALGVISVYEVFVAQKMRLGDIWHLRESISSGKGVPYWWTDVVNRLGALAISTAIFLAFRVQLMGTQLPVFTRFDNPASVSPFPVRHLTFSYLWALNALLLLFPCDLCCDWTMGTVPLVKNKSDPRNLATIALLVAVIVFILKGITRRDTRKAIPMIMGVSLTILPFLPATNIFFPVGFVVAERVLYIPSMGFCMIVAQGWDVIRRNSPRIAWLGMALLLLTHSYKTISRNRDWESEYSIFMSGLKVNQKNAKLYNNVGHALERQGRYPEALVYFEKAVSVQSDDVGAYINLGRTFNNLKKFEEAESAYIRAKSLLPKVIPGETYEARVAPNYLHVFLNLANLIARNETRLEEADRLYKEAISMREDYTQAYINRGDVLLKMNRTKDAQEVYERALVYDGSNPDIYYNLGVVFLEQGRSTQALTYFNKAIDLNPEHEQSLLNSAVLIQEMGTPDLRKMAIARLMKILESNEENEKVYFSLGMLAMDEDDLKGAEHWFRKAVQVKNDFVTALFNLALLLSDNERALEAIPVLNQLVKHQPDHIKAIILLGDIYFSTMKDLEGAEKCYQRVLALDPENIQGLHNMCVVYVERGELERAERCLDHVHNMAPHKEYVSRHLKIGADKWCGLIINISDTVAREASGQEEFHSAHCHAFEGYIIRKMKTCCNFCTKRNRKYKMEKEFESRIHKLLTQKHQSWRTYSGTSSMKCIQSLSQLPIMS